MGILLPDERWAGTAGLVVDPRSHAGELPLEAPAITVHQVHRPRHDRRRVAPAGRGSEAGAVAAEWIGDDPGDGAAWMLVEGKVAEPLREEAGDIHVEARRPRKDLSIPGPPESLIALRTVGRDVEEVAALPPDNVPLQLVQQRVRRHERPGLGQVGVDHHTGDGAERRLTRHPLDLHVAEAVIGEVRLPRLIAAALEGVAVLLEPVAQVVGVELALGGEDFAMGEGDRRACTAADSKPDPARHVLAEVVDHLAGWRAQDGDGGDLLRPSDRLGGRCDEDGVRRRGHRDRQPALAGESRAIPPRLLEARVVALAAIDVGEGDGAGAASPRAVGRHALHSAVGVADLELREQCHRGAIGVSAAAETEVAAIPAVAEHRADGVLPLGERGGDVVGLILQAAIEGGPPWGEEVLTDTLAIEVQFVEAARRDVDAGRSDRTLHGEAAAEERGRGTGGVLRGGRRSDPLG